MDLERREVRDEVREVGHGGEGFAALRKSEPLQGGQLAERLERWPAELVS